MKNSNFKGGKVNPTVSNHRTVLHCDADSFFASCETMLHPEYASVPMAVCGSVEDRHGIVLAKNALAKKYKIKTGEAVWQAKQKCPSLLTVRPTYGLYSEISEKMNRIFYDYTDLIEPFGVDESWLDVSGSLKLFGGKESIAQSIQSRIFSELGITVSIGVSFNKVFAKLGSDLNKPNGISYIPPEHFASRVWPLPVYYLLFVGPACTKKLYEIGIRTIGDLAVCEDKYIEFHLGKNGIMLKNFALGKDCAEVSVFGFEPEPKSVSNGMTFKANLVTDEDVSFAVTYLSMSVAERLRKHGLCCKTLSVTVKSVDQTSVKRSVRLERETCLFKEMSGHAYRLALENRPRDGEIYAVTVHAENLVRRGTNHLQQRMFSSADELQADKLFSLESAVDSVRMRYGREAIVIASSLNNPLLV